MSNEIKQFIKDYSVKNSYKIKRIVEPLKNILCVDAFWYNFISFDGQFFSLGSNEGLTDYFFSHNLWKNNPVIRHPKFFQNSFVLMEHLDDPDFQDIQKKINEKCYVYPILGSFEKDELGVHNFGFGTTQKKMPLTHLFLNNLGLVKKFTDFFRKEASFMIEDALKNSIDISSLCGQYFYTNANFDKEIQPITQTEDPILFNHCKSDLTALKRLSKREKECLFWMIQGKTGREIADKLHLSPRTIEFYFENCKNKLGCCIKSELFEKALIAKDLGFLV